jgi:hypothetical protein
MVHACGGAPSLRVCVCCLENLHVDHAVERDEVALVEPRGLLVRGQRTGQVAHQQQLVRMLRRVPVCLSVLAAHMALSVRTQGTHGAHALPPLGRIASR